MKLVRMGVILLMTASLLVGCGTQSYPENVVAVVNGETITQEEIKDVITERKLSNDMYDVMQSLRGESSMSQKEAMMQSFGIKEQEMTPVQKRFFEGVERSSTKMLTENEALNVLLVEEVLYQEATKQGHDVSVERAKEVLEESKKITQETLAQSKDALEEYNNYLEKTASIYHQYGFASEDDYLNQRIDRTARSMAINTMYPEFNRVIADKLPNTDLPQMEQANAWVDYGEFLLDKAKVKILKPEFKIEHYGESWSHGKLKLVGAK